MQLQTTLTSAHVQEAARLSRSRFYWLRFFAYSWYATALCLLILFTDGRALLDHRAINWSTTGGVLAVAAVLFGIRWTRWRSRLSRAAASRGRAASISIDPDGIRTRQDSGATTFVPWSGFTKWSEGKNVFLLSGQGTTTVLPVDETNRDSVRALLQGNIAAAGRAPARV